MAQSFKEILTQVQAQNNTMIQKESGHFVAFELLSRHSIEHNVAIELSKTDSSLFSAKEEVLSGFHEVLPHMSQYESVIEQTYSSKVTLSDSEVKSPKTGMSPTEVLNHIQSIRHNPLFYKESSSAEYQPFKNKM